MKRLIHYIVILIAYLWLNLPTFHNGLFQVYDNVQVTRVAAMYNELATGQFPVRYIDAFGQGAGYFLFKYYSPLIYYVGALFHSLGFSLIKSVKLVYLLFTAIGAMGIWTFLRAKVKQGPALLGSLVFLTSPYLYHDFFHRGTLTEAAALMLVPWVWWAFMRIKESPNKLKVAMGGLSLGLIFLTHSLTGMMVLGTLILYLVIPPLKGKQILPYLGAIVLGFAIAAFSLYPAVAEKGLIQYENNSLVQRGYLDHPVPITDQLMGKQNTDQKSAYAGITLLVGLILLAYLYSREKKFRKEYGMTSLFVIVIAVGGLFLMAPQSAWIWEKVSYLRYLQFPFRLLTIVTVSLSLGFAIVADYLTKPRLVSILLVVILVVPLYLTRSHYLPLGYQYGTSYTVDDPCMTTTWADEYLSKWTEKCLLTPVKLLADGRDSKVSAGGRVINFNAAGSEKVQVGKYYFPGWKAVDQNGHNLEVAPSHEHGLIIVTTDQDSAEVTLKLGRTTPEKIGDITSVIALLVMLGLVSL